MILQNAAGNREIRSQPRGFNPNPPRPSPRPFGLLFDSTNYPFLITTWLLKNGIQRFYWTLRDPNLPIYTDEFNRLNYAILGPVPNGGPMGGIYYNGYFRGEPYFVVDV